MIVCDPKLRIAILVSYVLGIVLASASSSENRYTWIQIANIAGLLFSVVCRGSTKAMILAIVFGAYLVSRNVNIIKSAEWDVSAASLGILLVLSDVFISAMPSFVKHRRVAYCVFACCLFPILALLPAFFRGPGGAGSDAASSRELIRAALKYSEDVYGLKTRFDVSEDLQNDKDAWKFHNLDTDTTAGMHTVRNRDGSSDIFIFFSGTESDTDWKTNVSIRPSAVPEEWHGACSSIVKVHGGFLRAFESVRQQFTLAFDQELKMNSGTVRRIVITGHSLGGGLATICGMYLACTRPLCSSLLNVITFGAPQVGDPAFVKFFNQHVPTSIRVVTPFDPVPRSMNIYFAHVKGALAVPTLEQNQHLTGSYADALGNSSTQNILLVVGSLCVFGACFAGVLKI